MAELSPMHKEKLFLKFDGPALAEHSIDVFVLGPALTGLGEFINAANTVVNGKDVKTKVSINADVKANCVTVCVEVLQSVYEQITQFLGNEHVKNAKEIFEWLGLVTGSAAASIYSVRYVFHWLANKRKPGQAVGVERDGQMVVLTVGEESIKVDPIVFQIASDPAVQHGYKELLSPLGHEGISDMAFIQDRKAVVVTSEDAKPVLEASDVDIDPTINPQVLNGHIVIYSPTFSEAARTWKFKWNDRVESIDIKDTDIAKQVLARGNVGIGDAFRVKMEITEKRTRSGGYKQYFRVIEVYEYVPYVKTLQLPGIEEE